MSSDSLINRGGTLPNGLGRFYSPGSNIHFTGYPREGVGIFSTVTGKPIPGTAIIDQGTNKTYLVTSVYEEYDQGRTVYHTVTLHPCNTSVTQKRLPPLRPVSAFGREEPAEPETVAVFPAFIEGSAAAPYTAPGTIQDATKYQMLTPTPLDVRLLDQISVGADSFTVTNIDKLTHGALLILHLRKND